MHVDTVGTHRRFRVYDPRNITVTWNGRILEGFAEGDFVEVERASAPTQRRTR